MGRRDVRLPVGRACVSRGRPGSAGVRQTNSRASTFRYLENIFRVIKVRDPSSLQNRWRASIQALYSSIRKNSSSNLTDSFLLVVLGRTCS